MVRSRLGIIGVVATTILLAACAGGAPPTAPGVLPGGPVASAGGAATAPPPAGAGPQMRQTGARWRVMNAYAPLNADPGAVDVYAGFMAQADQRPLITVPYGTLSDWFDPGAFDEDGNAHLTYQPAGKKGQGDQIMSKSETIKGDERVTAYLTTGPNTGENGQRLGQLTQMFEKGEQGGIVSAAPGRALLFVMAAGVENTLPKKDRTWSLSAGAGCLSTPDPASGEGPQPVGMGSSVVATEPTVTKLTLHEYGQDLGELDCKTKPILEIPVQLTAGGRTYLFLFSPGKDELRAVTAPIDH